MLKDGDYVGVQSNGTTFPFPLFFEFFFLFLKIWNGLNKRGIKKKNDLLTWAGQKPKKSK